MGLFDFLKKKEAPKLEDWTTMFPAEIVNPLLAEIKNNPQACKLDEIPNCTGEFGLEKTNPIPVYGIPSNETYLHSLRTLNGEVLRYRRNGSLVVSSINNRVDEYEIYNFSGDIIAYLYLSPYHWKTSTKAPVGFYVNGSRDKISKKITSPVNYFNQKSAHAEYEHSLRIEDEKRRKKEKERLEKLERAKKINVPKTHSNFKSDWREFKEILDANNINSLFHFTSITNLKSIINNSALFSWHYCELNNINISEQGGNQLSRELDTKMGLQDFVRVSFTRNHPMMFAEHVRKRNNIILEIDTDVIYLIGSKYANMNAAKNEVNVGSTIEDFKQLRFDLLKLPNHFNLSSLEKPFYQGEILVPTKIPINYIKNLDEVMSFIN